MIILLCRDYHFRLIITIGNSNTIVQRRSREEAEKKAVKTLFKSMVIFPYDSLNASRMLLLQLLIMS